MMKGSTDVLRRKAKLRLVSAILLHPSAIGGLRSVLPLIGAHPTRLAVRHCVGGKVAGAIVGEGVRLVGGNRASICVEFDSGCRGTASGIDEDHSWDPNLLVFDDHRNSSRSAAADDPFEINHRPSNVRWAGAETPALFLETRL